jgi:Spy/CpxP family protein refolding chaperone
MKILSTIVLLATGLASATTSLALAADMTAPAPAASATTAPAKPHHHARLKARQQHRQLAARALGRRLDLNREQKTQLKSLHQKTAADVRGIRQESALSPDQKKAKIHDARQGARAQASGVLTPDQKKKAAKLRHHLRRLAAK